MHMDSPSKRGVTGKTNRRDWFPGIFVGLLLFCGAALGQDQNPWPCVSEVIKSGGAHAIRVGADVSNRLAQKRVLPEISDLRDRNLDSTVVIAVIVDTKGKVRCANPEQGDPDLIPRSEEAAQKWEFRPYMLNGEPVVVDTHVEFTYRKHKVKGR
jgi:Gram-negative bacterial TonB protein C-terminal